MNDDDPSFSRNKNFGCDIYKVGKEMVLSPGFEPGYSARKAEIMGRTTPRELKILLRKLEFNIMWDFKLQMTEA